MKNMVAKIFFSAFALVLTFIIKNKYVDIAFFLLSIIVLEEDIFKTSLIEIKKKNFSNKNVVIILISIFFIIIMKLEMLLEFLLFYNIYNYIYECKLKDKYNKILDKFDLSKNEILLKTVSGYVKTYLKDIKVGDIVYIKQNEPFYMEGILLNEIGSYEMIYTKKEYKINKLENVVSGSILRQDSLIKVTSNYYESNFNKMISLIKNINSKNIDFIDSVINKVNHFIMIGSFACVFLFIIFSKMNQITLFTMLFALLFISVEDLIIDFAKIIYTKTLFNFFKNNIYFRKENVIDNMEEVKTVIFSKEGVLTNNLVLNKIIPVYESKEELLKYAAYAEYNSNHPIAKAILSSYKDQIDVTKIYFNEEFTGKGVRSIIDSKEIHIGNESYFDELEISYPKTPFNTPICLMAINKTYVGTFVFNEVLKDELYMIPSLLRENNIDKVVLMSSSNKEEIKKIGTALYMNESYASLTLNEKVEILKMYKKNSKIAYVDSFKINDIIKENTDIPIIINGSNADVIINNLNDLIFIKKQSNSLVKKFELLILSNLLLKLILLVLIVMNIISLSTIGIIFMIYYLVLNLLMFNE